MIKNLCNNLVRFNPQFALSLFWKYRNTNYYATRFHPHRDMLMQVIYQYNPKSVLEIGCNCAPNLFRIGLEYPKCKLVGCDINAKSIQEGRSLMNKEKMEADLYVGEMIPNWQEKKFDIVLTDACLIYVGPKKIVNLADKMVRMGKKAIVMVEHYDEHATGSGYYEDKTFRRNYKKLFNNFEVNLIKIPSTVWGHNWATWGYIITVNL